MDEYRLLLEMTTPQQLRMAERRLQPLLAEGRLAEARRLAESAPVAMARYHLWFCIARAGGAARDFVCAWHAACEAACAVSVGEPFFLPIFEELGEELRGRGEAALIEEVAEGLAGWLEREEWGKEKQRQALLVRLHHRALLKLVGVLSAIGAADRARELVRRCWEKRRNPEFFCRGCLAVMRVAPAPEDREKIFRMLREERNNLPPALRARIYLELGKVARDEKALRCALHEAAEAWDSGEQGGLFFSIACAALGVEDGAPDW